MSTAPEPSGMRLDKWLWAARLYKTRAVAVAFIDKGRVQVNGQPAKRSRELPDVAAIAESVPGYDASLWSGLLAPRGTPPAVIDRLYRDTAKLLQSKDVQDAYERVGTYVVSTNPKAFGEYVELEYAKWRGVVRAVNLQIN